MQDNTEYDIFMPGGTPEAGTDGRALRPGLSREQGLEQLHIQLPFLPIDPPGNAAVTAILVQNVAQEIRIPSGTKMLQLSALSTGAVLWAFGLVSDFPTSTAEGGGLALINNGRWIYCQDMSSVAVIANAAAVVSVRFHMQL